MADNIGKLNYQITADQSQFTVGMKQAGDEVERFAQKAKAQSNSSTQAFEGMARAATQSFSGFQTGGLLGGLASSESAVMSLGNAFVSAGGLAAGVVVGIVAGLAKIIEEAGNASKAINDIKKTSEVIGETPFNTQVLQRVLEKGGIAKEEIQPMLLKFLDRLGDLRNNGGQGPTGDALRRIGLDPRAIGNASPEKALEEIINALGGVNNAYDRLSATQAIFAKQFTEVVGTVRRGRAGFEEARRFIRATGPDPETFAMAAEAQALARQRTQNSEEFFGNFTRNWQAHFAMIAQWWGRGLQGLAGQAGTRPPRPDNAIPEAFQFDTRAERVRAATEAANTSAEKLATQWRDLAEHTGMSARQVEILRAKQAGASDSLLSQLRIRDSELSILERRNAAEAAMKSLIESNRTSLEKFYATLQQINLSSLDRVGQSRGLAATFRDLEKSLGGGGATDLTLRGTDVGSLDAFRLLANRGNAEQSLQARILDVLQAAREIQEQTLRENEEIARILREQPGIGIAPIIR